MQDIIAKLTAKNDEYACAITDKIISESKDTGTRESKKSGGDVCQ